MTGDSHDRAKRPAASGGLLRLFLDGPAITVFLNNQIGTCDCILPVMLEVHARSGGRRIDFVTFDHGTFEILQRNIVLREGIESVGRLVGLGGGRRTGLSRFAHRLRTAAYLGVLALRGVFRRTKFIHFKVLNRWPLRLLYLVNRRGTYWVEGAAYGFPPHVRRVVDAGKKAGLPKQEPTGRIIVFDPASPVLHETEWARLPRYVFDWPRVREVWLDFVRARADAYIAHEFERAGIVPQDEIVAFMMSAIADIPHIRHPDSLWNLFLETLDMITDVADGMPVFIKPHYHNDLGRLEAAIAARPGRNLVISHLHPGVLATRARFFVSNFFSTTLADGFTAGLPTIEYSDYKDETLALTNGGSFWPDFVTHFINHDREAFRRVLTDIMKAPRAGVPPKGKSGDPGGLLAELIS